MRNSRRVGAGSFMYYAWSEPGVILPPKSATASRQGGWREGRRGKGGWRLRRGWGGGRGGRRGRKERGGKGREFAPGCRFKTLAQISRLQSRWAGGGGGWGRLSGGGGGGGGGEWGEEKGEESSRAWLLLFKTLGLFHPFPPQSAVFSVDGGRRCRRGHRGLY